MKDLLLAVNAADFAARRHVNQRRKGAIGQQYRPGFIQRDHSAGNRLQNRLQLAPPLLKRLIRLRKLRARTLRHVPAGLQILRHVNESPYQLSHFSA